MHGQSAGQRPEQPPRPASAPLIEAVGLYKRFGQQRGAALIDVSLAVPARSFVALVGPSGSGKTTLLKCINRLVEPDSGEVRIGGRPISQADAATLRRGIGYDFQGIGLFPHMTVAENIGATPALLGWPKAEIAARVAELLELMGLPEDLAARRPDQLSGGQRQRVGVARAIAARPGIVLMDEPFGALDPLAREEIGNAYRDLHDRLGLTTVMVTHDMQEAVVLADRIVVLAAGRIVADDTPRALMSGKGPPAVADMMASPRRQAERVSAVLAGKERL